jgi:RHS repeat-associated protein
MPNPTQPSLNRVGIRNSTDYSPFGVELDGRTVSLDGYRFGYQGSEKDNEFKGQGNSYTTEFRQLDPRLGRWVSVDPVIQPWQSSYCSMDDNPISKNDPLGDKPTPKEAALMAKHVYGGNDAKTILKGGWQVSQVNLGKDFKYKDNSGFKCQVYERTRWGKTEYSIAFAGTEFEFGDIETDITQPFGVSKQFDLAIKNAVAVNSNFKSGTEVTYLGHSLGGGLATLAALKFDKSAITFNPAWLSLPTIYKNGLVKNWASTKKIDNYVVLGEVLDVSQRVISPAIPLVETGSTHFLKTYKTFTYPQDVIKAHTLDFLIWELRDVEAYNKVYNPKTGRNEIDK